MRESTDQNAPIPPPKFSNECIQCCKSILWNQLNGGNLRSEYYLSKVETELHSRLNIAFNQKVSTSLLVIGPVGSGKKRLVESLLESYIHPDKGGIAVARIKGLVCSTDQQALCSIADQFLLRSGVGHEKNINIVLEDLEAHFRQCMLDGHPAVVMLEDLHIFATREKQVLIYTLLDFMHKQDLLFVVIGLTPCAHLNHMLEKRVLSRLNAQFIYIPPASGFDVVAELRRRLLLPKNDDRKSEFSHILENRSDTTVEPAGFDKYREQFNGIIETIFPVQEADKDAGKVNNTKDCTGVSGVVHRYAEWGRGIVHFLRAAQVAVSLLCSTSPFLTEITMETALWGQDPPDLVNRLSCLALLELHLFAAAARLYGRKLGAGAKAAATTAAGAGTNNSNIGLVESANTSANSSVSVRGQSKAKKHSDDATVDEVFSEFDALTGSLRLKEVSEARVIAGLVALANGGLIMLTNAGGRPAPYRLISDKTVVLLVPPEYEVLAAFDSKPEARLGPPVPPLMVTERVRRAVLEPLASIQ